MSKRWLLIFISILLSINILFAETEGERLFRENQTDKAIIVLENDIKNGSITVNTYNFLGLAYYQLKDYEKSIKAFQDGMEIDGVNKVVLFYNLGNSFFMSGNLVDAIKSYKSVLEIDKNYSSAYLNKANCEVSTGFFEDAISDYEDFLLLESDDIQRPQIEELLRLLREEVKVQKENERLAELQRKAEEEAEMAAMVQMISDEIENDLKELAQRDDEEKRRREEELNRENSVVEEIIEEEIDLSQAVEEDSMLQQAIEIENERILREKEEEYRRKKLEEEQERQKQLQEELEKKRIEEEKAAGENNKKIESDRRRKLLEDIANSLQIPDEQNINSGSGEIIEYEYESELE